MDRSRYSAEELEIFDAVGYGRPLEFGNRPAVLVVDVTYGFTGDRLEPILEAIQRFPLSSGQSAWKAVHALETLLELARGRKIPIIYTKNAPRRNEVERGAWGSKTAPPETSSHIDPDAIVERIAPEEADFVVQKTKPSGFFSTPLASWLIHLGVDTLLVGGGTTSGCLRATVVDAFSYNLRVFVVEECCFDRSPTSHAINLFDMHQKYAEVITLAEARRHLEGTDG